MFLHSTYGGHLPHPCKHYFTRYYFIQDLTKRNISCSSETQNNLCNGTSFNRVDAGHIIDLYNSEKKLRRCNKNIYGNIILTDSIWNRQMGWKSWKIVKKEKKDVYKKFFRRAQRHIERCDPGCVIDPNERLGYIITPAIAFPFVCCFVLGVCSYYTVYKFKLYKNEFAYELFLPP
jgi:hypothetical protein